MNKKSILKQIASLFTTEVEAVETPMEFVDVKTIDSRILRVSDLALEASVKEITEAGEVDVEDGTFELEDGTSITVMGGVITEISTAEEEAQDAQEEAAPINEVMESFMDYVLTDGKTLHIITTVEGEITAGDKVQLDGEDAPAGEYEWMDGKILVVDDNSAVVELKEKMAMESEEVSDEEKVALGVVNNLKELISQVKDLKSQFDIMKSENESLKLEVEKFSKAPSAQSTKVIMDFKSEKNKIDSPLHRMLNK